MTFERGWMLRRRAQLLFGFAAAFVVLALGASAGAAPLSGSTADESFQAWFVQLKTPPAAKGGSKATLAAEREAFFKKAADQGLAVKQRHAFDQLWNGVSVSIPSEQAGALAPIAASPAASTSSATTSTRTPTIRRISRFRIRTAIPRPATRTSPTSGLSNRAAAPRRRPTERMSPASWAPTVAATRPAWSRAWRRAQRC